jgi:hypothetical protein
VLFVFEELFNIDPEPDFVVGNSSVLFTLLLNLKKLGINEDALMGVLGWMDEADDCMEERLSCLDAFTACFADISILRV